VFNVLLQILDEGRLTDSQGRTVDFKNTVLIMTSNLGSQDIQAGMAGKDELDEKTRDEVMDALRSHFRPEFLNRVDEIVVFEPLRKKDIHRIVDLQLGRLSKLLADKRLTLELTDKAHDFLSERGYDPTYGARPLKRAVQKYLLDPLAMKVLSGEFVPGDHILADAGNGQLTFAKVLVDTTKNVKRSA
jgi:ATP-dependent Clp protease ATP-binding subunit ClpB